MSLRIALLGFGTVGQSVARLIQAQPHLSLTHVFNRGVARKRVDWLPNVTWTESFADVVHARPDIVVEVVGGREPAGDWIAQALAAGADVVTANKQLIANDGDALLAIATRANRRLLFEAAVAGGIPVIRGIREGLAGDRITRVLGVLNGTCNYILTRMESSKLAFEDALAEAQAQGFAEADPTDDLDGNDARAKLSILARVALGRALPPSAIACGSIRPVRDIDFVYAAQLGTTIRQVSRAVIDGETIVAGVQPALVPLGAPLARAVRNQNMVLVTGDAGGDTGFFGFGAGGGPTAVAVMSDVLAIAAARTTAGHDPQREPPTITVTPVDEAAVRTGTCERHYVRFVVDDRPGIIASIASACATHGINIDSVLQIPWTDKQALPFVVTLDPCGPEALAPALDAMRALPFNVEPPFAMPVVE